MTRPGVQIITQSSPPTRSAPTDSGVAFMVGLSDRGSLTPNYVQSIDEFISLMGARVTYSPLYDAVDVFFREGGNAAWISRVVGPAAISATKNLLDASSGISLVVKAIGPGAWGNSIQVAVLAGLVSGFRIQITYSSVIVETSPDLATQLDAQTWASGNSNYVLITQGASANVPAVAAAASLLTGTDDRANITDTQWKAALDLFTKELGPGQVMAPGRTTDVGHTQLADHGANYNRVALLDLLDVGAKTTLESAATNAKTTGNGQYAASFTPWVQVPGTIGGAIRTVAPSAAVAGVISRVDAQYGAARAAAGALGQLQYVIGLSQPPFTDADRQELNGAGVNVIRFTYGNYRVYGYRSLADPINNPDWVGFNNSRYLMWLAARCAVAGEAYVFDIIDGQGHLIAAYGAALSAICQSDYTAGFIYGQKPADAFNVDVGPSVNTPATIADGQLIAVVAVRPSPFSELVTIRIVNVPITEPVG